MRKGAGAAAAPRWHRTLTAYLTVLASAISSAASAGSRSPEMIARLASDDAGIRFQAALELVFSDDALDAALREARS